MSLMAKEAFDLIQMYLQRMTSQALRLKHTEETC